MSYDLGDTARLAVQITDSTGTLANASSVTLTVTLPDGTSSGSLTPTNTATGVYQYDYTPATVGRHGVRWVATGTNAGAFTDVFDVADPALLPIASLAEVREHIGMSSSDTSRDEQLRRWLAWATDLVEQRCNKAFRRQTVVETHAGGTPGILLRQPPALSITSVVENGTTLSASGYFVRASSGVLYRGTDTAPSWFADGTVVVTYVAGYANPPQVAVETVLDIVKWRYQQKVNGPHPAFGADSGDYTTAGDALPAWLFRPLDGLGLPGIA